MVIAEKATERWGAVMKHVTTACVIITLYGSCVVVLVLMGDFLSNISGYWDLNWRYGAHSKHILIFPLKKLRKKRRNPPISP